MIQFNGNRWRWNVLWHFIINDRLSIGKFRRVRTQTAFFAYTTISTNASIAQTPFSISAETSVSTSAQTLFSAQTSRFPTAISAFTGEVAIRSSFGRTRSRA